MLDKLASQLIPDKSLYQFVVHLYSRLACDLLQLEFWLADSVHIVSLLTNLK